MKSTMRIDFRGLEGEGSTAIEPVIRVNLDDSEDVRDGLLNAFFQGLGDKSNWLVVNFHEDTIDGIRQTKRITISPVKSDELKETMQIINNRLGYSTTITAISE